MDCGIKRWIQWNHLKTLKTKKDKKQNRTTIINFEFTLIILLI